ncbi:hypothetical protein DFH09DRAFT_633634 [Mycena vulgaris]|nr:hypothetical protein DFH09DRAFT_633634 [Mycena vulgaris]
MRGTTAISRTPRIYTAQPQVRTTHMPSSPPRMCSAGKASCTPHIPIRTRPARAVAVVTNAQRDDGFVASRRRRGRPQCARCHEYTSREWLAYSPHAVVGMDAQPAQPYHAHAQACYPHSIGDAQRPRARWTNGEGEGRIIPRSRRRPCLQLGPWGRQACGVVGRRRGNGVPSCSRRRGGGGKIRIRRGSGGRGVRGRFDDVGCWRIRRQGRLHDGVGCLHRRLQTTRNRSTSTRTLGVTVGRRRMRRIRRRRRARTALRGDARRGRVSVRDRARVWGGV